MHQIYLATVRGDLVPASFNRAWLVYLRPVHVASVASPASLRPLTLWHSCQKVVAKALPAPLEEVARTVLHEAQRGFARGRQMASNLVGAAAATEEFLHDSPSDPGLILLDTHVAHPSIDWSWIQWVLRRTGIPDLLIDATPLAQITDRRPRSCFMGSGRESGCGSRLASSKDAQHGVAFGRSRTTQSSVACYHFGRAVHRRARGIQAPASAKMQLPQCTSSLQWRGMSSLWASGGRTGSSPTGCSLRAFCGSSVMHSMGAGVVEHLVALGARSSLDRSHWRRARCGSRCSSTVPRFRHSRSRFIRPMNPKRRFRCPGTRSGGGAISLLPRAMRRRCTQACLARSRTRSPLCLGSKRISAIQLGGRDCVRRLRARRAIGASRCASRRLAA